MKKIAGYSWGLILCCLLGCSQSEPTLQKPTEFTGNEVTYELVSASEFNVSGTATLKERLDGSTSVLISLSGIDGTDDMELPVHLHYGDITGEDADVAALLSPVKAKLNSETILTQLSDESFLTYSDLKLMSTSNRSRKCLSLTLKLERLASKFPRVHGTYSVSGCSDSWNVDFEFYL